MENKLKHLEFIQNTISRMAGNLFFLRGWAITLIAALFALFAKEANHNFIFVVYFPVFIFWVLDGYFLSQERLFRALYDHVRQQDEKHIDFSMNTKRFKKNQRNSWMSSMYAPTILVFYVPLLIIMLILTYLIY